MNLNNKRILFIFILAEAAGFAACKKDDSKMSYGYSYIYMPQAINQSGGTTNNYPVPSGTDSSTYNYSVDTVSHKLNVTLGALLSGPGTGPFSLDITVNNDTIGQMLATGALDTSKYELMPATLYTLPSSLNVTGGKEGTFNLSLDIAQLKSAVYAGKYLVLAVKLANPVKYKLDTALSTTIVIVNVDALVIGPSTDITARYIQNPGGPFVAVQPQSGRWGTLASWSYNAVIANPAILNQHADFTTDNGGVFQVERYGSSQVLNGKIYQSIQLPAGTYTFSPQNFGWQGIKDTAYCVASLTDSLPNFYAVPSTSLAYATFYGGITFTLPAASTLTVGVVLNFTQDQQGFAFNNFKLVNYPKHL